MTEELVLFEDAAKQRRIGHLDYGRVFVGTKNPITLYLGNTSEFWPIKNIKVNKASEEIIIDYPQELEAGEIKPVTISWNPNIKQRKPLDAKHLFVGEVWIG